MTAEAYPIIAIYKHIQTWWSIYLSVNVVKHDFGNISSAKSLLDPMITCQLDHQKQIFVNFKQTNTDFL